MALNRYLVSRGRVILTQGPEVGYEDRLPVLAGQDRNPTRNDHSPGTYSPRGFAGYNLNNRSILSVGYK